MPFSDKCPRRACFVRQIGSCVHRGRYMRVGAILRVAHVHRSAMGSKNHRSGQCTATAATTAEVRHSRKTRSKRSGGRLRRWVTWRSPHGKRNTRARIMGSAGGASPCCHTMRAAWMPCTSCSISSRSGWRRDRYKMFGF